MPNDFETIAVLFPNLIRLELDKTSINQLTPIVGRLPKLTSVSVDYLFDSNYIDLVALNDERKKMSGACKVTIYVIDQIYLETKMAAKHLYFEHNLTEIKRLEEQLL